MNKIQKKRLTILSIFVIILSIAIALILFALKQNINVFLTPSQLAQKHFSNDYHFRLGGMVKKHSVQHVPNGLAVNFIVTDFKHDLAVHYEGVLPDLFREGKGIIAEGYLNPQGVFIASTVLAKHDENYMPKNVYKALREPS